MNSKANKPSEDTEPYIGLDCVARMFPGAGDREAVNGSTVFRWATKGMRTRTGSRVFLRATKAGARWLSKKSWVEQFQADLLAASLPTDAVIARSPTVARKAAEAANRELELAGA